MKKGIALLIAIGFIVILSSLIAYMFSISEKVFDEVSVVDAKNQKEILFSDVKSILDKYAKDVKNSDDLDTLLLGVPPFFDKKSKLSLQVAITPLSNKININSILVNNQINPNLKSFIEKIGARYNILDVSFLIALILDTIDQDDVSRQALSEISRENIKFSNSRIVNMEHFQTILKYYIETIKDKNILNVPWDQLIYFGNTQRSTLDCDRMSDALIDTLGLNAEDFGGCEDLQNKEDQEIAKKYVLKPFDLANSYYLLVKITYTKDKVEAALSFIYDLKSKKMAWY